MADTQNRPEPPSEPPDPAARPRSLLTPAGRGVINGVVFALLLMAAHHFGVLTESRSLTLDDVTRYVIYGIVFGAVMFVYGRWRDRRGQSPEQVARRITETRAGTRTRDDEDG